MDNSHLKAVSYAYDVDFLCSHDFLSVAPQKLTELEVELPNIQVSLCTEDVDNNSILLKVAGEVFLDEAGLLIFGGVNAERVGRLGFIFRLPHKLVITFLALLSVL